MSKVYLAQTFALAKLATYAAMKIPTQQYLEILMKMMTYNLNFFFFFIRSPSISPNTTVVIKTMISDKTVFYFQHCDHQLTLVIVVQLPRLPVDVFVSLRLGLMSVLGKHHCFLCLVNLDKSIRTICFSVNSSFICCNVF